MIINQIIKKNNILTDGNLPDRAVLTQKLVNVLYANYEQKGEEFTMQISDLCHQLQISNSSKNHLRVSESLKILKQPIEVRNFEYQGRGIKWHLSSFLQSATVENANRDFVKIKLDEMLIAGMQQYNKYTQIEIETSNKFKSKYGIVIWEMFLRYQYAKRDKMPIVETVEGDKKYTYQDFSLEDLNKKFGTKFLHNSKMQEGINRGLKEIENITKQKILCKWQKIDKCFRLFWELKEAPAKWKTEERAFIKHIREKFVNVPLHKLVNYQNEKYKGEVLLACGESGKLYDMQQNTTFTAKHTKYLWNWLFTNQDRITALKQSVMEF